MASAIQLLIVCQRKCGIVSLRHQLLLNLLAHKLYWSLKVLVVVDFAGRFRAIFLTIPFRYACLYIKHI